MCEGWDLPRGSLEKEQGTRLDLSIMAFLRGLCVKPGFIFFLRPNRGQGGAFPPAALVANGAGDQGRLELGRLREKVEEFEGNSRGCLPTDGDGQKMAGGDVDGRVGPLGAAVLRWTPGDEERCNTCGSAPRSSQWRPLAPMANRAGESGKATGGCAPRDGPVRRR
jgi:hypothetical protein